MSIRLNDFDESTKEAELVTKITKLVKKRNYSLAIEWEFECTGEDDDEFFEDNDFHWMAEVIDDDGVRREIEQCPTVSGDGSLRSFHGGDLNEVRLGYLQPRNIEKVLKMFSIQAAKCSIPKNWSAGLHFHIGAHDKPLLKRFDMAYNLAQRIYKKFKKEIDMRMNPNTIPGIDDLDWHPNSQWCKPEYNLGEGMFIQNGYSDGCRYRFINFASLRRWGTIEVRSFFSPKTTLGIYSRLLEVVKALDEYETCMTGEIEEEPTMFELNLNLNELQGEEYNDEEFGTIVMDDGIETDKELVIKDKMSKLIFDINQKECKEWGDLDEPSRGEGLGYTPTALNILSGIPGIETKI